MIPPRMSGRTQPQPIEGFIQNITRMTSQNSLPPIETLLKQLPSAATDGLLSPWAGYTFRDKSRQRTQRPVVVDTSNNPPAAQSEICSGFYFLHPDQQNPQNNGGGT